MAEVALVTALITLDTSGLYALVNRDDPGHKEAKSLLLADPGPYLVPVASMGEVAYLVEQRLGVAVLDGVLSDIESGGLTADCGDSDVPRIRELVSRYSDLELGYVDAAVIACAERNGGGVLTFDRRDFAVVAREGLIEPVP